MRTRASGSTASGRAGTLLLGAAFDEVIEHLACPSGAAGPCAATVSGHLALNLDSPHSVLVDVVASGVGFPLREHALLPLQPALPQPLRRLADGVSEVVAPYRARRQASDKKEASGLYG